MRLALMSLSAILCCPLHAAGQQPTPTPTPPCATPDHRQFDFWIGDWEVTDGDGAVVGHNRIEQVYDGCALREEWTSANGWRGGSLNLYSKGRGNWHQTWVDQSGRLLLLDGGLEGADMVLAGTTPGLDGKTVRHQIRWSPLDDGRIRQHWRTSTDGGATWTDSFVGFYRRK